METVYLLWCSAYSPPQLLGVFSSRWAASDWLRKQNENGSITDCEKAMCYTVKCVLDP